MQDKGQEHLVPKLPKNIGWSMGTELRESQYVLSAKNSAPVQRGMIFHVSLGTQPALLPSWLKPESRALKSVFATSALDVLYKWQRWRHSTSCRCAFNTSTIQ